MKLTLATLAALAACAALAGCSTAGKLDRVLLTTITGDRAFVASTYGPIGVTAELRAEDARELQRLRERARDAEELVRLISLQQ